MPDLILSDFAMPGMTGLGLLEELKRRTGQDELNFVLITGQYTSALAEKAIVAGYRM